MSESLDIQPEQPKRKVDFPYLRALGSLPDNVYYLPRPVDEEPPEPPDTKALAA